MANHTIKTKFVSTCFLVAFLGVTLAAMVGHGAFLRVFLSYAYNMHLFVIVLLVLCGFLLVTKGCIKVPATKTSNPGIPIAVGVIFLWFVYVGIYSLVGPSSEQYYVTYLLVVLVLFLSVYNILRSGFLSPQVLYVSIALPGVIEAVVVLLQWVQVSPSTSPYFSIAGTVSNPNIAAMTIVLAIPACLELATRTWKKHRYLLLFISSLMVLSVVLTHCRSGLLALLIISAMYAYPLLGKHQSILGIKPPIIKYSLVLLPLMLLLFFLITTHQQKSEGDGRTLIWRLSTEMVAQRPLQGYGYGYFEKAYNLYQADYFNEQPRPESEQMKASFTAMAYNEYLEQSVMGGLIGGLLFLAVILTLLLSAWRQRRHSLAPLAGMMAFALMSLFNFTVAYPILFVGFLFYAALCFVPIPAPTAVMDGAQTATLQRKPLKAAPSVKWDSNSRILQLSAVVCALVLVVLSLQKYEAQRELTKADRLLKEGQRKQAGTILHRIEPKVATSEAFYTTKARYEMAHNNVQSAYQAMLQLLNHTSHPSLYLDIAMISARLNNVHEAETYFKTACGIEPHRFKPRVMLMDFYHNTGQLEKARQMAQTILDLKPKIDSDEVRRYKQLAQVLLNRS